MVLCVTPVLIRFFLRWDTAIHTQVGMHAHARQYTSLVMKLIPAIQNDLQSQWQMDKGLSPCVPSCRGEVRS